MWGRGLIELGIVARPRHGPHVKHPDNLIALEQIEECIQWSIGMADRADKRLVRCEVATHTEASIMKDRYALCNTMVTRTEESSTALGARTTLPAKHARCPARKRSNVNQLPG